MMLLEDYTNKDKVSGIEALWRIFAGISSRKECREWLAELGIMRRLITAFSDPQIASSLRLPLLQALHHLVVGSPSLTYSIGHNLINSLHSFVTANPSDESIQLMIDLIPFCGMEETDKQISKAVDKLFHFVVCHTAYASEVIKKRMLIGLQKIAVKQSSLLCSRAHLGYVRHLIYFGFIKGDYELREESCRLVLLMVKLEIIDMLEEFDLLAMIVAEASKVKPLTACLQHTAIEVLYRMAVSPKYTLSVLMFGEEILRVAKTCLHTFHADIRKHYGHSGYDSINIEGKQGQGGHSGGDKYERAEEEEEIIYFGMRAHYFSTYCTLSGYRVRLVQERKIQLEQNKPSSMEDENSDELTEEDKRVILVGKSLVKHYDKQIEKTREMNYLKGELENRISTFYLIKIITFFLSCDIFYSKVLSLGLHSLCGIVLDSSLRNEVNFSYSRIYCW